MATRSRIGLQLQDGSILSAYCHWDGYPEFNGVKLVEHFNSYDKAAELIDGGDISALWTNAGWNNESLPTTGPLYYSERGDSNVEPSVSDDLSYFLKDANTCGGEYAYLFANNEWKCYIATEYNGEYGDEVAIPSGSLAV